MQKSSKKNASFSLIELLVTITILFIVMTLAIPKFSFFDSWILKNELNNLAATISFLQKKATTANEIITLTINRKNNCYSYKKLSKDISYKMAKQVVFDTIPNSYGPPSAPNNLIKNSITFSQDKTNPELFHISLFPDYTISSGTIYLTTIKHTQMYALSSPISQVSLLRKYRYENNHWLAID